MTDARWDKVGDPPMHYDRLGVPISLREWALLYNDKEYFRIGSTVVDGHWWISTVWLGLVSNPWGPPLVYETMVFNLTSDDPRTEWELRRYHTEDEARIGHLEMVHLVETMDAVTTTELEGAADEDQR